ncbi:hypothetical protein PHLCEN_2v5614 [Hermanssonia centrifuga]|uniref:Uncharacterized protein n=1 Tax=Hermanssonia centrifuga TaxID=98765 RepID=A0A2R6P1Z1_9APHY|nr:hypothetical protein PHLCEN_2v5614 [Hermanssonia centrifuga]
MPTIWSSGWRLVYDPAAPVSAGSLSRLGHGRHARQFCDPAKLNLPKHSSYATATISICTALQAILGFSLGNVTYWDSTIQMSLCQHGTPRTSLSIHVAGQLRSQVLVTEIIGKTQLGTTFDPAHTHRASLTSQPPTLLFARGDCILDSVWGLRHYRLDARGFVQGDWLSSRPV